MGSTKSKPQTKKEKEKEKEGEGKLPMIYAVEQNHMFGQTTFMKKYCGEDYHSFARQIDFMQPFIKFKYQNIEANIEINSLEPKQYILSIDIYPSSPSNKVSIFLNRFDDDFTLYHPVSNEQEQHLKFKVFATDVLTFVQSYGLSKGPTELKNISLTVNPKDIKQIFVVKLQEWVCSKKKSTLYPSIVRKIFTGSYSKYDPANKWHQKYLSQELITFQKNEWITLDRGEDKPIYQVNQKRDQMYFRFQDKTPQKLVEKGTFTSYYIHPLFKSKANKMEMRKKKTIKNEYAVRWSKRIQNQRRKKWRLAQEEKRMFGSEFVY